LAGTNLGDGYDLSEPRNERHAQASAARHHRLQTGHKRREIVATPARTRVAHQGNRGREVLL